MRRAKRQRALIIAARHGAQSRLDHADDRRQDHHRQQQRRGKDGVSPPVYGFADRAHKRHQHGDAEESIDDGWNARHQLNGRLYHAIRLLRAEEGQIHRREDGNRHSHRERQPRHIDAADDHREDAVDVRTGLPHPAQQKIVQADFLHRRQSVCKKKDADQRHACNGHTGRKQKDDLHECFLCLFHAPFLSKTVPFRSVSRPGRVCRVSVIRRFRSRPSSSRCRCRSRRSAQRSDR